MIYSNCPLHSNYELQFIKIRNLSEIDEHSIFYCATCLDQFKNQESKNFLSIQRIIQSSQDQILQKWPPLNDNSILEDLGSILNGLGNEKDLIEDLNQFFNSFLISVQEKINSKKVFFISKLEQAFKDKKEMTQRYFKISKVDALKNILQNQQVDLITKEKQLKELLSVVNNEINLNTQILNQFVESMNVIKQINNLNLQNAQNQILNSLDCFGNIIDENEQLESTIMADNKYNSQIIKPSISYDSSLEELDKILDFSIINSNSDSKNFLQKSIYIQNKINDLIQTSQINFVVDSTYKNENEIRAQQIEQFAELKFQDEEKVVQNPQPNEEQKSMCFTYDSCISSLNKILNYLVQNNLIEDKKFQFNNLQQNDLLKVIDFATHLQNQQNEESYLKNVQKTNHVRVLNDIISEKLSSIFSQNQIENYLIETFPSLVSNLDSELLNTYKQNTSQLKYNLMPLIVFKQATMNRKLNPLNIKKLSNGVIQIKATQNKYYTQCFSDVLSANAKLVFRFKIECTSGLKNLSLGLVYDKMVCNNALICELDCQLSYNNNELFVIGGAISNSRKKQNTLMNCKSSLLEVRVHLNSKLLEVTDFPNYKNKFSLHEQFINKINDKQLRLFIYLNSPSFTIQLQEFFAVNEY
ncbi:hypothetical protein TTHERM_00370840 (macronuclear) [Tetrahymena thermophila SB210]|uniref:Zinc carboxypeptidase family protein n=1 Tax=Tetrahymena thermophila (strain SB210) TaxID=312017 RepID=I7M0K1_TETTS|nr:hypothetical protein TTHERM_00370840 [Tetrahymena thermophila SB210]EAR89269.2 hypothetical protein TTHERM_00370840 [Tetrahymena thermophila SB210]|eukprot:XP_001009514.2 hypothetical protein TTHERM_00370840 [Tetrahymena thermophila SB210]